MDVNSIVFEDITNYPSLKFLLFRHYLMKELSSDGNKCPLKLKKTISGKGIELEYIGPDLAMESHEPCMTAIIRIDGEYACGIFCIKDLRKSENWYFDIEENHMPALIKAGIFSE